MAEQLTVNDHIPIQLRTEALEQLLVERGLVEIGRAACRERVYGDV